MSISVRRLLVIALLSCLPGARLLNAADAVLAPRLAVIDKPSGTAVRVLEQAGTLPFPVAVYIVATLPPDPALEARLATLAKRRVPVWLVLAAPAGEQDIASWQAALKGLLEKHGDSLAILEVLIDRQPARVASFALEIAATEARARREAIRIAIGGPAMADRARREEIYRPALAPYVDLLDLAGGETGGVAAWLEQTDPGVAFVTGPSVGPVRRSTERMIERVLGELGSDVTMHAWPATDETAAGLRALAHVADLLTGEISSLDPEAPPVCRSASERPTWRKRSVIVCCSTIGGLRPTSSTGASRPPIRCRFRWCCLSRAFPAQSTSCPERVAV